MRNALLFDDTLLLNVKCADYDEESRDANKLSLNISNIAGHLDIPHFLKHLDL